MPQPVDPWNSLEIARFNLEIIKVVISVLTPLIVATVGYIINNRLKQLEQAQWANHKLIEKRIAVFDDVAPLLNDLLCYFTYVGCWKDKKPDEIVKLKRELDRKIYVNAPLFQREFLEKYNAFMSLCYMTYAAWGQDAKLRTDRQQHRDASPNNWDAEWDRSFTDESDCSTPSEVGDAYRELMCSFSSEIGIGLEPIDVPTGSIPSHIK